MPGICGIIGAGDAAARSALLRQMVHCMTHEPFYTSDTYTDPLLEVCVGCVNREGSFTDCMPIWNEARDICLFFSGEDFTDRSEIDHLRAQGHPCGPEDASYLVHLYEELGSQFFRRLNGWFSGLILDLRQRQAVLFNDRYGLHRIYYHSAPHGFFFASEAKALLRVLPSLRQLNLTSLGEFFSCGCPLQNKSLFSGISILPGGSAWSFTPSRPTAKTFYFQPDVWEDQELLSETEYYEKLRETFGRILPRYFHGKERSGISLTGGVDSRLIMAWAQRPSGTLPCYTFGGMFRDCTDVRIARRVAETCGQPYQIIPLGEDFLAQFPVLAAKTVYITDGAMDVSGSPDLFVNRIARGIAPARLTGNYGGEILRSLIAFKPVRLNEALFTRDFAELLCVAAKTYAGALAGRKLSFVAFKQVPWHHYSRFALELSQVTLRSPYLDNDLVALAFRAPPGPANTTEFALRLIVDGNPALGKIETDRGILYRSASPATRLRHWCREFTFKAEYAYDYGMPHWLAMFDRGLRQCHMERLFLGRHKFYHFRLWYRDVLAPYVAEILLDPRTRARPYFEGARLEEMVREHAEGRRNYTLEIHRALTSELIQRQLIEM